MWQRIRTMLAVVALVGVLAQLGAPLSRAQEATPIATGSSGDFDARVNIGGRSLALECQGQGSPTVVLEAGLGIPAQNAWTGVMPEAAKITRVCRYDRANNSSGRSDPAPLPRSGADAVADLHALLHAAGVPGPYVLVGHSVGGLLVRLYVYTYPDEVAGLILLDASHEDIDAIEAALVGPELWAQALEMWAEPDPEGFFSPALNAATVQQLHDARATKVLPAVPAIVMVAGIGFTAADVPPGWPVDADNRLWAELQREVALSIPQARFQVAEGTDHFINLNKPDLVVTAILDVVQAVRDPSSWEEIAATPAA